MSYDLPTVAVAGKAPYLAFLPGLRTLWSRQSLDIDFVEFEVDNPSLEFMVDTLEFLPKAGVVAIDIWHPRIQAVAGVTDAMESAGEAGSIDFVAFRDSDLGSPNSHNVAFAAAMRSLRQANTVVDGAAVLIVGDQVPAQGVRAALAKLGAAEISVVQLGSSGGDATDQEHARALAAVDVVLNLSPAASVSHANGGKMLRGFAETWNAERIREILEISTAQEIPADISRDFATVFATHAAQDL